MCRHASAYTDGCRCYNPSGLDAAVKRADMITCAGAGDGRESQLARRLVSVAEVAVPDEAAERQQIVLERKWCAREKTR